MKTQIKIIFLIHDFLMFQKSDVPNSDKSKKVQFSVIHLKVENIDIIRNLSVRADRSFFQRIRGLLPLNLTEISDNLFNDSSQVPFVNHEYDTQKYFPGPSWPIGTWDGQAVIISNKQR